VLVRYEAARRALAEAHRVDEVKDIRDKAEAMRMYGKQANDTELVNWAAEIKIRAERKCGELLGDMAQSGERPQGRRKESHAAPLSDIGLSNSQSSRYQQIAAVPTAEIEELFTEQSNVVSI